MGEAGKATRQEAPESEISGRRKGRHGGQGHKGGRFSRFRKETAILRLIRGEDLETLSREVGAYRWRISGPLLDRIDLHVEVPALAYEEIASAPLGEGTAAVRARVERARALGTRLCASAESCSYGRGSGG